MNQKELLWISITVFLTVVAWMLLDIYRIKTQINIESGLKSLQTVDFTLRSDVLKMLKEKTP
ncbi:hypothetical protein HY612_01785 [Candidatus Roizmanbacteria bacterium]|nr:hypothetical protein [Candidatus Roizmanbacteria bacterium]